MGTILYESVEELISSDESIEKNKKQQEYVNYIKEHVLNVQIAFNRYFIPLLEKDNICEIVSDQEFKEAINRASVSILDHDSSKYSDEEFDGYREKYYPTVSELANEDFQKQVEERSEKAWEHHYTNNWHHPKYWFDSENNIYKDMNLEAIIEMICDWTSFNIKSGNPIGVLDWYTNKANSEKASMSSKTKLIVEEILFKVLSFEKV